MEKVTTIALLSALNLTKAVIPRLLEVTAFVPVTGLAWGRVLLAKTISLIKKRLTKTIMKSSFFITLIHDIFKLKAMSKKTIIILAIILSVLIIGSLCGYFLFLKKDKTVGTEETNSLAETIKEKITGDLTYEDSSGFSFKYPKAIEVEDITPDDEVYYTQLSLTKSSEKLTISAKDTKETTVDNFIKNTPEYKLAQVAGATTLGGIAAKQYTIAEKFLTVSIDKGVLYLIEGPTGSYWEDVQNLVVSSFTFAGTSTTNTQVQDNAIYEEEVVE